MGELMKIDRLISIILYLNNRGRITAGELAQKYQVSIKTIRRDLDVICAAGIPIVSYQGQDGGYEILAGFKLDRSVLTGKENQIIVNLMEELSKTCPFQEMETLYEKFKSIDIDEPKGARIFIDFSTWGTHDKTNQKMKIIETAFNENRTLFFQYHNLQGEYLVREVEPIQLILKWSHWYLFAWCKEKNDYRLFKIRRMNELRIGNVFHEYHMPKIDELDHGWTSKNVEEIKLKVSANFLKKIEDYFDDYKIEGEFVTFSWPSDEWLYSFILSLGPQIEVIAPLKLRQIIKERINRMQSLY